MLSTAGYSDVPANSQVFQRPVETHRYSSRWSPCRHEAWTISSSLGLNEGAPRMASEDSRPCSLVPPGQPFKLCHKMAVGVTPSVQLLSRAFPADCPHRAVCHCACR